MRWFGRITLVLLLLLAAYTAWPFVDLYRLSAALEAGNINAIQRHVSFAPLRNSVSRQVLETYLAITGDEKVGRFTRGIVMSSGVPAVETIVAEDISPERLAAFLAPREETGLRSSGGRLRIAPMDLQNLWSLYASSDYKIKDFHVAVPPEVRKSQRLRLRMRLSGWSWKLVDIQLPHEVRIEIAQRIVHALEKRQQSQEPAKAQ